MLIGADRSQGSSPYTGGYSVRPKAAEARNAALATKGQNHVGMAPSPRLTCAPAASTSDKTGLAFNTQRPRLGRQLSSEPPSTCRRSGSHNHAATRAKYRWL